MSQTVQYSKEVHDTVDAVRLALSGPFGDEYFDNFLIESASVGVSVLFNAKYSTWFTVYDIEDIRNTVKQQFPDSNISVIFGVHNNKMTFQVGVKPRS